jgi:hypothetical protein
MNAAGFQPISVHPDNPHYYLFRGKPTILITSAEHYGAVINHEFDYMRYLDCLAQYKLNYTRIYPGALIEREEDFIAGNTLAPRQGALLLPWARSSTPGYALGGNKFDLDRWDEAFFARLRDFMAEASKREIVVEICFFNAQYANNWQVQALSAASNIQGVGTGDYLAFQTMRDPALLQRQTAFVVELLKQVNDFDNLILEICDEPGIGGTPSEEYHPWISHLIDVVIDTETALPNKHLIAQQVQGDLGGNGDFSGDPRVNIIVGQYAWHDDGNQFGGIQLLKTDYEHNKPIELNETAYYPVWYTEDREAASRVEAWEFMIGGGASFNQLNGMFTIFNPTGSDSNNLKVLRALLNLRNFIESFDFIRMTRDTSTVYAGVPVGACAQCMSEPGQQYAFYIHHSVHRINRYVTKPGIYQENLAFDLPRGHYIIEWHSPESGLVVVQEHLKHFGGCTTLVTPPYCIDIALKIVRA